MVALTLHPTGPSLSFPRTRDGKNLADTVPKWDKIIIQDKWVEIQIGLGVIIHCQGPPLGPSF